MAGSVIRLDMNQLPAFYKALGPRMKTAAQRGALRGALASVSILHRFTVKAGAVNTGAYRLGWKGERIESGARVFNRASYAAIIEYGRRANSRFPPLPIIERWARRKLGLASKEAKRAAYPIARAIARRGLPARDVMRDAQPEIQAAFLRSVFAELDRELHTRGLTP